MCVVCGCDGNSKGEHGHGHDHHHEHHHPHSHGAEQEDRLDFGAGEAGGHVPGMDQSRLIQVETDILAANDQLAADNRKRLAQSGTLAINMMSSPGAGKTTLLVETINALKGRLPVTVIEGDQQTANDAARIRETGVPAVQVNTGKGCHLDGEMVGRALERLHLIHGGLLFIENVGNLVCPAGFDLGEGLRVVLASVTEGEDKPLKYPDMFASADVMLISKTDLLPHLSFDVEALIANARKVQPGLTILLVNTVTPDGLAPWLHWLDGQVRANQPSQVEAAE